MTELNDYDYYVVRAQSVRQLAQRATNPAIAAIHATMLDHYESIVAQFDREMPADDDQLVALF